MPPPSHLYLIGVGANQRSARFGAPRSTLRAALQELPDHGIHPIRCSPLLSNPALGPSRRSYLNGVWLVESCCDPDDLLTHLKSIERAFGRRTRGKRWSARPIDLDVIMWSGGWHVGPAITVPHPEMRNRAFVLRPASGVAGKWRDPVTGLTIAQLWARLRKPRRATEY